MHITLDATQIQKLRRVGFEVQGNQRRLPTALRVAIPSGVKLANVEQSGSLGAYSYVVSGFLCGVHIGNYCSFGEQVQLGRQSHPLDWLSTSPFTYMANQRVVSLPDEPDERFVRGPWRHPKAPTKLKTTQVDHDVWIGHGAMVVPGVHIATGAIVALGSVVTKDVPPYAIVGGNPARVIRTRVPEGLIPDLLESRWWEYAPAQLRRVPMHDAEGARDAVLELRAKGVEPTPAPMTTLGELVESLDQAPQ